VELLPTIPSRGKAVIGNDVWIGRDAVIMPGVTIGDGAIIAGPMPDSMSRCGVVLAGKAIIARIRRQHRSQCPERQAPRRPRP
jgi:serine acetyltransferase